MREKHERLIHARKCAGFATAQEAADSLGVKYPTYAGHENGTTGMRAPVAEHYARRFKVSLDWLLTGRGDGPSEGRNVEPLSKIDDAKARLSAAAADLAKLGVATPKIGEWMVDAIGAAHADIARQEAKEGLSKTLQARGGRP